MGQYGEQYRWTRVAVIAVHNGRLASVCQFELEDEAAAFAYAEERMRATSQPARRHEPRQPNCAKPYTGR